MTDFEAGYTVANMQIGIAHLQAQLTHIRHHYSGEDFEKGFNKCEEEFKNFIESPKMKKKAAKITKDV